MMRKLIVAVAVVMGLSCGVWAATEIPTDFKAAYMSVDQLKQKLNANNLQVLGTHQVAGNKDYTVVVYTSKELQKLAQLKDRGFCAVLRILVNSKDKQIKVSNPEYFLRAFLQKDYKSGCEKGVKASLEKVLGKLTPTKDALSAKKLKSYHFMMGMPYYEDFQTVAKGNTADLLKKLQKNAKGSVVFTQNIKADGSVVLCGVALPAKIEKFNEKLGTMGQSQLLPYSVLIGNGEARILHAKFYLALSFPRLTMGQFMKIRAIPSDIKDQFKKYFK